MRRCRSLPATYVLVVSITSVIFQARPRRTCVYALCKRSRRHDVEGPLSMETRFRQIKSIRHQEPVLCAKRALRCSRERLVVVRNYEVKGTLFLSSSLGVSSRNPDSNSRSRSLHLNSRIGKQSLLRAPVTGVVNFISPLVFSTRRALICRVLN